MGRHDDQPPRPVLGAGEHPKGSSVERLKFKRWPSIKVEVETLIYSGKDDYLQFLLYVGDLEPGDEGSVSTETGLTFITRDDRRHLLWHGAEPPPALLTYMEVNNKTREQHEASAPGAEPIRPYRRSRIERGLAE